MDWLFILQEIDEIEGKEDESGTDDGCSPIDEQRYIVNIVSTNYRMTIVLISVGSTFVHALTIPATEPFQFYRDSPDFWLSKPPNMSWPDILEFQLVYIDFLFLKKFFIL